MFFYPKLLKVYVRPKFEFNVFDLLMGQAHLVVIEYIAFCL